ncbi:hypothetical protein H0H93_000961 [Arthromyces matolae]|nr:hypothetical protein H0H93_000961 [Arthromyces matolae]
MDPIQFNILDLTNYNAVLNQRLHGLQQPDLHRSLEGLQLDLFLVKQLLLLKRDPLPTSSNNYIPPSPDQHFWHAFGALADLTGVLASTMVDSPAKQRVLHVIKEHWDMIWKWARTGIHRAYALEQNPLPEGATAYLIFCLQNFAASILHVSIFPGGRELAFSTKADICLDLWHLHVKHPELDKYVPVSPDAIFCEFYTYFKNPYEELEKYVPLTREFCRLAYQRTKKVFSVKKDYSLNPAKLSAHVAFLVAAGRNLEFIEEQVDLNCIPLYTGILVRISQDLSLEAPDKDRCTLVENVLSLLLLTFKHVDVVDGIRRYIESGLLLGVLQAAPTLRDCVASEPQEDMPSLCILMHEIRKHFGYISILRAFNRAMRKPDHLKALRRVSKVGLFWQYFVEMQQAAGTRTMALGEAIIRRCEYLGCQNPDLHESFKRCSDCEDVLYCSVKCQRADWTEDGHKPYCQERARPHIHRFSEYGISADDQAYILMAFGHDLLRHGLICNLHVWFNQGDFQKLNHPRILCDHSSFPPVRTIAEKADGAPGHLTIVSKFLHGTRWLVVHLERPLDKWPLVSATSDLNDLLRELFDQPQWWDYEERPKLYD